MLNIVIDDKIPFLRGVLEPYAQVSYLPYSEITRERILQTDALIIRTRTRCNAELLKDTAVRFIASATIGHDHIDTDYCLTNNITWTNASGCNAASVEQYVLAALLELAKKNKLELKGKTLGIVGVGNVGSRIAKLAQLLGMQVLLCDPPRARKENRNDFISLLELAQKSDIVSVHVSLSRNGEDKTYGLISEPFFSALKQGAIFINSSRGEVVDEQCLIQAIAKKHLSACVLDVWHNEPLINQQLLQMVDIATPHIAGYSTDGKANGSAMAVNALSRFFGLGLNEWKPQNLPIPENTSLTADLSTYPFEEVLLQLVKATYPIMDDDERLRRSPETFEQQRGSYPLRREYNSYSVTAINANTTEESILSTLGFALNRDV